jgi:ATP-dependent DNA ligase
MAAVPGRLPLIEPMLATPALAVPGNETEWGAEAKWDGARVLACGNGGTGVLRGRSGGDVTGSYPEVAAALGRAAGRRTMILDGEITVFDGDRPSFALLLGGLPDDENYILSDGHAWVGSDLGRRLAIEISPVDHASVRHEDPAPARAAPARG